jgi:hypothetical protein
MRGGQVQHFVLLLVLVTHDNTRTIFRQLSKNLQRPGKLYYVTVYYAMLWVFKISLFGWCFIAEPMLWPLSSHNLRLIVSYQYTQASSDDNMYLMHPHAMTKASSGYRLWCTPIAHHISDGVDFSHCLRLIEVSLPREVKHMPLNCFQFYPHRLYPMTCQRWCEV